MKDNQFYAMLARMKFINRWGLMRNTRNENICEHSLETAFVAHALGIINNEIFHGNIDANQLAVKAMYHDVTEIITGDMPTPVKYYNPLIRDAYREVEDVAKEQLLQGLPQELVSRYDTVIGESEDEELNKYVKAADKISALVKCIEEKGMGNGDFAQAELTITKSVEEMEIPEVKYFLDQFLASYKLTLDESN